MQIDEILGALGSELKGLSPEEAEFRLRKFGYNKLKKRKRVSLPQIFLAQFKNIFMIMLLVAIAISLMMGWLG